MQPYVLTNRQARLFLLRWQGLAGPRRFAGAQGVVDYVRQAGCVQFDPVDLCGKNAEIVLFSRVQGFTKPVLERVLYKDRTLLEHWDKNMAIYPAEDWPALRRTRQDIADWYRQRHSLDGQGPLLDTLRGMLAAQNAVCGQQLETPGTEDWGWGPRKLASAGLEYLYFLGEAAVHHRKGAQRHYALAEKHLPKDLLAAPDPNADEAAYYAWHTLRRIAAVGLLWERASDAFLGIPGTSAQKRAAAFARLRGEGRIVACTVEGLAQPLYCPANALPLLEAVLAGAAYSPRLEFLAPLDGFLWDRKLIRALFGFEYTWEIYTPAEKRKYGPYTLPVLYGTAFAGRIQMRANRALGTLAVSGWWPEDGFRPPRGFTARLQKRLGQFARLNGCARVDSPEMCSF